MILANIHIQMFLVKSVLIDYVCTCISLSLSRAVYAGPAVPRYVRVNTLKISTKKAITILRESIKDVSYSFSIQLFINIIS